MQSYFCMPRKHLERSSIWTNETPDGKFIRGKRVTYLGSPISGHLSRVTYLESAISSRLSRVTYLGSIVAITDLLGRVAETRSYDPFGTLRNAETWCPAIQPSAQSNVTRSLLSLRAEYDHHFHRRARQVNNNYTPSRRRLFLAVLNAYHSQSIMWRLRRLVTNILGIYFTSFQTIFGSMTSQKS